MLVAFDGSPEYSIPKDLPTDTLDDYREMIQDVVDKEAQGEHDPDMDFAALITKINKRKAPSGGTTRRRNAGVNSQDREPAEVPVYHSAEYVIDSEDEDDVYFDKEEQLRQRTEMRFTKEQEERLQQALATEADKKRLLSKRKGIDGALAVLSRLQESGEFDNEKDVADHERDVVDHDNRRRRAVSLDDDSDDDEDSEEDKENRRPPPKSTSDVESDEDDEEDKENHRASSKSRSDVERDQAMADATEPSASQSEPHRTLSERLAASTLTSPNKKRRAIILDSDEEDEDEDEDPFEYSDVYSRPMQSPARKRVARQQSFDEEKEVSSDGFSDGGQHLTSRRPRRAIVPMDDDSDGFSHNTHERVDSDEEGNGIEE